MSRQRPQVVSCKCQSAVLTHLPLLLDQQRLMKMNHVLKILGLLAVAAFAVAPLPAAANSHGVPYHFSVNIHQTVAGGFPLPAGGLLPPGCGYSEWAPNVAEISCAPNVPGAWTCDIPGTIAQVWSGSSASTVTGKTWCSNSPVVTATAVGPGGFAWSVHTVMDYDFQWKCRAEFAPDATGSVYCGEIDP